MVFNDHSSSQCGLGLYCRSAEHYDRGHALATFMCVLVQHPIYNIAKTVPSITTRGHELTLVMYSLFHHPSCKPPPDIAISTTKPPAVSPVPTQHRSTLSFSCKGSNTTNYSDFPTVTIKLPFQAASDCAADGVTWRHRELRDRQHSNF